MKWTAIALALSSASCAVILAGNSVGLLLLIKSRVSDQAFRAVSTLRRWHTVGMTHADWITALVTFIAALAGTLTGGGLTLLGVRQSNKAQANLAKG